MCSAAAEPEVMIVLSGNVELPRVVELILIAVGRGVPHRHFVARGDRDAAEFDIAGCGAAHVNHR